MTLYDALLLMKRRVGIEVPRDPTFEAIRDGTFYWRSTVQGGQQFCDRSALERKIGPMQLVALEMSIDRANGYAATCRRESGELVRITFTSTGEYLPQSPTVKMMQKLERIVCRHDGPSELISVDGDKTDLRVGCSNGTGFVEGRGAHESRYRFVSSSPLEVPPPPTPSPAPRPVSGS